MAKWPKVMVVCGAIFMLNGLFMDTTISTGLGRIHNLGLMQRSWNLVIVGGVLLIGGLLWGGSSSDRNDKNEIKEDIDLENKMGNFVEQFRKVRQRNKERWKSTINSIPKDHLALRVLVSLITGLTVFLLVLSLFDRYEMNFFKFMLAFVFFPAGFWVTLRRPDVYKSAMPILTFLTLGLLILWFGLWINIGKDAGWFSIISVIPLLISHFSFRRFNVGLSSPYLLKFLLVFMVSVAVLAFGAPLLLKDQ